MLGSAAESVIAFSDAVCLAVMIHAQGDEAVVQRKWTLI